MLEKELIGAIKSALSSVNVYHDFAPQGAKPPLVILSRVGGAGHQFVERVGAYEVRVQVSCWADNRVSAVKLSQQVEQALFALPAVSSVGAAVSAHDVDTDWRGMRQDFVCLETVE